MAFPEHTGPFGAAFSRLREFANAEPDDAAWPHGIAASARAAGLLGAGSPDDADIRVGAGRLQPKKAAPHGECDLCSLALSAEHRHLVEVATRNLICACDGCALTFHGVSDGRYRLVPRDAWTLDASIISDVEWNQLSLPINLAFFVRDREDGGLRALYPSPGGVTESRLPIEVLEDVFEQNIRERLEPLVEAVLVNRLTQKHEVFIVPIDLCYELTGLIRVHWKGLSGGEDVRREMNDFFERLRARARPAIQS